MAQGGSALGAFVHRCLPNQHKVKVLCSCFQLESCTWMMPTTGWKQINKINKNLAHNTVYHCQDYTEMTSCICFSLLGFTPPTSEIKQRQKKKNNRTVLVLHTRTVQDILVQRRLRLPSHALSPQLHPPSFQLMLSETEKKKTNKIAAKTSSL